MSSDELKGRVEQAAGDLTDDKDLKREGKIDETAAKMKQKIEEAAEKAKDALRDH